MYLVGHAETLMNSPPWAALLQHARSLNCLFHAQEPFETLLTSSSSDLVDVPQPRLRPAGEGDLQDRLCQEDT